MREKQKAETCLHGPHCHVKVPELWQYTFNPQLRLTRCDLFC